MNKEHCIVGKYSSGHVSTADYSYVYVNGSFSLMWLLTMF